MRDGPGTWILPGSTVNFSSIPDPKGYGIRSAVALANLKDYIDWFDARHNAKNAEKFCSHGIFDIVVATYSDTFVSMDHFGSNASVFW